MIDLSKYSQDSAKIEFVRAQIANLEAQLEELEASNKGKEVREMYDKLSACGIGEAAIEAALDSQFGFQLTASSTSSAERVSAAKAAELVLANVDREGVSSSQVQEATGLNAGQVRRAVAWLVDEGKLRTTGEKRSTRYHLV